MQPLPRLTEVTQPTPARRLRRLAAPLLAAHAAALLGGCSAPEVRPQAESLSARSDAGAVTMYSGDELMARVRVGFGERVALSRLRASNGVEVLRGFPLEPRVAESVDHPEQTGLWWAHRGMNDDDLWYGEGAGVAREHVLRIESDTEASLKAQVEWIGGAGVRICSEQRVLRFRVVDDLHVVDVDHSITATPEGLVLEDAREGFLALRLADGFRAAAGGGAMGSTGARGEDLWGARARWVAATSATADGRRATVCVLEDPRNPGHPTRWQVRPYGLLSANPFATGAFTEDPDDDRPAVIDSYGSLRLRYRIVVAPGALSFAEVDALWADLAAEAGAARRR